MLYLPLRYLNTNVVLPLRYLSTNVVPPLALPEYQCCTSHFKEGLQGQIQFCEALIFQ